MVNYFDCALSTILMQSFVSRPYLSANVS